MYSFTIYRDDYLPMADVNSESRPEFLQLAAAVARFPGRSANLTYEKGSVTKTIELLPEKDDFQEEGWLIHYALAVVEGQEEIA